MEWDEAQPFPQRPIDAIPKPITGSEEITVPFNAILALVHDWDARLRRIEDAHYAPFQKRMHLLETLLTTLLADKRLGDVSRLSVAQLRRVLEEMGG